MPVLNRPLARIYTPPTCTLEVTAQTSALSRWTRKPTVKSLQFLLSLEGQQHDRTTVKLRGDQTQLAELSAAVSQYLQELLARRASELTIRSVTLDRSQAAVAEPLAAVVTVPQLRPHSLLNHEFLLGHLATEQTGPSIMLKVSQLYDLAMALDDYAADFQSLADLAVAPTWRTALPLARSAAAVLLTVGLGSTVWRLFQPQFIATKDAGRSPSVGTALVPSPSPSQPLPSLSAPSLKPLVLPTIQLPSRSRAPGSVLSTPDQPPQPKAIPSGSPRLSLPSPSTPSTSQRLPGEIALAPAPAPKPAPVPAPISPPALEQTPPASSGLTQSFSTQLRKGASGTASDQATAPAAKAAPRSSRQQSESSSLFDTIPQVAEVRDSVAARWKPESLPPKVLEYRLTLNPNGTLAQVEPLGTSAQQYLTQLALPALGAPFVSAVSSGGRPIIRLVVSPDGTLQTFPDSGG